MLSRVAIVQRCCKVFDMVPEVAKTLRFCTIFDMVSHVAALQAMGKAMSEALVITLQSFGILDVSKGLSEVSFLFDSSVDKAAG